MISQFSVGNFLSFKEPCFITFDAAALKDPNERIHQFSSQEQSYKLLKSVSIYGSNSAGKSNLLKAFSFMKHWVVNSFNESNRILEIPVTPFLLRESLESQDSQFEVIFYVNHIRYRYGFKVKKESVSEEWFCFSEPKKREQQYFIRTGQEIRYNNSWKKSLTIKIEPIIPYVKPRVLFISVLAQFNVEIGNITIDWFNKNFIGFDFSTDYFINKAASLLSDPEYYIAIHELLKLAKLGFSSVEQKVIGKYTEHQSLSQDFINFALHEEVNDHQVQTKHNVLNEKDKVVKNIFFDLKKHESSGTQKFFALAGALLKAIRNKEIIWADELDSKMHPLLFETIVRFFNSNKFNHRGAQLIFTTHSTQLLKEKVLRRDQIFTVDKNDFGESTLKGLHTTNVRIDASHEKDYLTGKYGGIQKLDLEGAQLDLF